jgi:Pentapeptide repeats (8 copies)
MDIVNLAGTVLFTAAVDTVKQLVIEAVKKRADLTGAYLTGAYLTGADLRGADLRGADLTGADLTGADLRGADLRGAYLTGAYLTGAYLRGADLRGADLRGADLRGADGEQKKIADMRVFSSSLYPYTVMAVLFDDGEKMVRMGCLCKTITEWRKVVIRKSNVSEFPDDGSEKCEDRAGIFNLALATVKRMKLPVKPK